MSEIWSPKRIYSLNRNKNHPFWSSWEGKKQRKLIFTNKCRIENIWRISKYILHVAGLFIQPYNDAVHLDLVLVTEIPSLRYNVSWSVVFPCIVFPSQSRSHQRIDSLKRLKYSQLSRLARRRTSYLCNTSLSTHSGRLPVLTSNHFVQFSPLMFYIFLTSVVVLFTCSERKYFF